MQHVPAEHLLNYLKQRCNSDWLIGYNSHQLYQLTQALFQQLAQYSTPPTILLVEPDPLYFLSTFIAAIAARCPLFLGNPSWGKQEWQQVFAIVQPDLILGDPAVGIGFKQQPQGTINGTSGFSQQSIEQTNHLCPKPAPQSKIQIIQNPTGRLDMARQPRRPSTSKSKIEIIQNQILIPTGGTSGKIRFAIHTWETLTASVRGLYHYFNQKSINSFCVLPLYHVSGLMQFLRSFLTNGRFCIVPYQYLKSGKNIAIEPEDFFVSLVPKQLQFLIQADAQWLARFHTVLLGGAPAWEDLLETARKSKIRLALTYGMTETASQVVTLKPEDFLQGNNSSGRVLSHAKIKIVNSDSEGASKHQPGIITIEAESLSLGYYPNSFSRSIPYITDDLGYFDERGYLHIIGRNSQKIITGGENVFPAEVEAAILATQLVMDVCVVGLPDETWGQAVIAVYVPKNATVSVDELKIALAPQISKFKQPKYWLAVPSLPRNGQGKVNCDRVKQMAIMELFPM